MLFNITVLNKNIPMISYINQKETQPIYLYAQDSAIKFYEKLGFKSIGSLFKEVGIKHQEMIYDFEGKKAYLFPS